MAGVIEVDDGSNTVAENGSFLDPSPEKRYLELQKGLEEERERNNELRELLKGVTARLTILEEAHSPTISYNDDDDDDTDDDDDDDDGDSDDDDDDDSGFKVCFVKKHQPNDADELEQDGDIADCKSDSGKSLVNVLASKNSSGDTESRVKWEELKKGKYGRGDLRTVEPWTATHNKAVVEGPDAQSEAENDRGKHAMIWRRILYETRETVELAIKSKPLRKALKQVIKGYTYVSFDTTNVILDPPFTSIYHHKGQLQEYANRTSAEDPTTARDIELLLETIDDQQATVHSDIAALTQEGDITHKLLWSLFYPGCLVVRQTPLGDVQLAVAVPSTSRAHASYDDDGPAIVDDRQPFYVNLEFVDFEDGQFVLLKVRVEIEWFPAAKAITDLVVYPLAYYGRPSEWLRLCSQKDQADQRGRALRRCSSGPAVSGGCGTRGTKNASASAWTKVRGDMPLWHGAQI
jgi:hypothetical protein